MEIKSTPALVSGKKADIINFLSQPNNIEKLLPEGKIEDFKSDDKQCSFKVQGAIIITLVQNGITEDAVLMKSGEKSPFPFDLSIKVSEQGEVSEGFIHFQGEVNMFIKMMAEKPLTALFEHMTKALQSEFAD